MNYTFNEAGMKFDNGDFIPYEKIIEERNKFKFSHSVLVSFSMSRNNGKLYFQYVLDENKWKDINDHLSDIEEIYLGQDPDTNDEVVFDLDTDEVKITTDPVIVLDFVKTYNGTSKKNSNFDILESLENI